MRFKISEQSLSYINLYSFGTKISLNFIRLRRIDGETTKICILHNLAWVQTRSTWISTTGYTDGNRISVSCKTAINTEQKWSMHVQFYSCELKKQFEKINRSWNYPEFDHALKYCRKELFSAINDREHFPTSSNFPRRSWLFFDTVERCTAEKSDFTWATGLWFVFEVRTGKLSIQLSGQLCSRKRQKTSLWFFIHLTLGLQLSFKVGSATLLHSAD